MNERRDPPVFSIDLIGERGCKRRSCSLARHHAQPRLTAIESDSGGIEVAPVLRSTNSSSPSLCQVR